MAEDALFYDPVSDPESDLENSASDADMDAVQAGRALQPLDSVTTWCQCGGHCRTMKTEEENICCKEVRKVRARMRSLPDDERPECMTFHPGMDPVCFNVYSLQEALQAYRADYGELVTRGGLHRRYRYLAYRRFVSWYYGYLGRGIRKPLPACVVTRIRREFPKDEGEQYVGFKRRALD